MGLGAPAAYTPFRGAPMAHHGGRPIPKWYPQCRVQLWHITYATHVKYIAGPYPYTLGLQEQENIA
eukprot:365216-Chlamydomonas_euryale.AAC.3